MVFHGCLGSYQRKWDEQVRYSGYMEWAATNDIVLIFPMASYNIFLNPYLCWEVMYPNFNFDAESFTNKGT